MLFPQFLVLLASVLEEENGQQLSELLRCRGPNVSDLLDGLHDSRRSSLSRYSNNIVEPWGEIAVAHVQVVVNALESSYVEAYKEHAALVQAFLRFFTANTGWTLTTLYSVLRDLRTLAELADQAEYQSTGQRSKWREDAARACNKAFSGCVVDRTSPRALSRKWGTYYTLGLVLKSYFCIHTTSLSRNVIRALQANRDIPDITEFPRAHQVTYRYYSGMLSFLNEEYAKAEEDFTAAFNNCHELAQGNLSRILAYLLPLRLLRGYLPSRQLLDQFPEFDQLYSPFFEAIRRGDIKSFDAALHDSMLQDRLLDLGLYLIFEKAREICVRSLFRKVWLILERPTRIPVRMFHMGFVAAGLDIGIQEAECFIAIMIYRGFIKGYISHEKQIVVLAASSAFPKLSLRPNPFN